MRECERHPGSESQPGGGVCASCLEERLAWLWRGESFRHDNNDMVVPQPLDKASSSSTTTTTTTTGLVLHPEEVPAAPSLASVRRQLQVLGVARGPEHDHVGVSSEDNSKPTNSTPIIEEWAAFHAQRRRRSNHINNVEGLETVESKSESSSTMDTDERRAVSNPELRILMNAHKMRSQSMPLDFRSAEETAARVINECRADEDYLEGDELEIYEQPVAQNTNELQRCFSPKWQSPKWVKVLASPMTSRNRVFPSRSKDNNIDHVRKRSRSHKRGVRLDSSDWGFSNGATNGGSSPLWRGNATTTSRSVFSWLQDAETTQYKKYDQTEQLTSSSSSLTNSDSWLRDLTTVGHLHEIAEELEIVEESSEEEEQEEEEEQLEDLGDVSSFGKFLLQAAQRHPTNAHLTRLVSAP